MSLGARIFNAVTRSIKMLVAELRSIFGVTEPYESNEETQLLVNRVVAAVSVVAAIVLQFLPGDPSLWKVIANALFGVAAWLWTGKDPSTWQDQLQKISKK